MRLAQTCSLHLVVVTLRRDHVLTINKRLCKSFGAGRSRRPLRESVWLFWSAPECHCWAQICTTNCTKGGKQTRVWFKLNTKHSFTEFYSYSSAFWWVFLEFFTPAVISLSHQWFWALVLVVLFEFWFLFSCLWSFGRTFRWPCCLY